MAEKIGKENKYSKGQILSSKQYTERKDLLQAILADEELYSKKEVEAKIQQFMKGKVN